MSKNILKILRNKELQNKDSFILPENYTHFEFESKNRSKPSPYGTHPKEVAMTKENIKKTVSLIAATAAHAAFYVLRGIALEIYDRGKAYYKECYDLCMDLMYGKDVATKEKLLSIGKIALVVAAYIIYIVATGLYHGVLAGCEDTFEYVNARRSSGHSRFTVLSGGKADNEEAEEDIV